MQAYAARMVHIGGPGAGQTTKMVNQIAIAGGVAANSGLRQALERQSTESGWEVFVPRFEYCTDNAAMIAMAAHFKYLHKDFSPMDVAPMPRMKF